MRAQERSDFRLVECGSQQVDYRQQIFPIQFRSIGIQNKMDILSIFWGGARATSGGSDPRAWRHTQRTLGSSIDHGLFDAAKMKSMRVPDAVDTGRTLVCRTNSPGWEARDRKVDASLVQTRSISSAETHKVRSISSVARGIAHAESARPPISICGMPARASSSVACASPASSPELPVTECKHPVKVLNTQLLGVRVGPAHLLGTDTVEELDVRHDRPGRAAIRFCLTVRPALEFRPSVAPVFHNRSTVIDSQHGHRFKVPSLPPACADRIRKSYCLRACRHAAQPSASPDG